MVNDVELRVYESGFCQNLNFDDRRPKFSSPTVEGAPVVPGQAPQQHVQHIHQHLDPEKCTIGGQNEDSGKFHVRIRAPRHR